MYVFETKPFQSKVFVSNLYEQSFKIFSMGHPVYKLIFSTYIFKIEKLL